MAVTLLTRCRAFSFSGKNEERVILLRFYVDLVKSFQGKTKIKELTINLLFIMCFVLLLMIIMFDRLPFQFYINK